MIRRSVVGLLAVAASVSAGGCEPNRNAGAGTVIVTVTGFDGVESAIAGAKGKVVLIDCWATWCGPCRSSFPKLVEKHRKYADRGLTVISVSIDKESDRDEALAFLRQQGATFTNLLLPPGAEARRGLTEKLGYEGRIPHAALFDRTGRLVWSGHPMADDLPSRIEAELRK